MPDQDTRSTARRRNWRTEVARGGGRIGRVALLALACLALMTVGASAQDPGDASALALERVNEARAQADLPPLERDAALAQAASRHAHDMASRHYYDHRSPEGDTVADRYQAAGGSRWVLTEENIARCTGCPTPPSLERVEEFQRQWMNSPEHRRNILARGITGFGFAMAAAEDRVYAVQTFAGPGTPRAATDAAPETLDADAATSALLSHVNAARRKAGVADLKASDALDKAAQALLARDPAEDGTGAPQGDLYDLLPSGAGRDWRVIRALVSACGGCGVAITDADVADFARRWLSDAKSKTELRSDRFDALGAALGANGEGRKSAVLILGAAR